MSLPIPKVSLDGSCSTIFNNTLYTFSANAFQSLDLRVNATWTPLPMGEPVTGAVCVQSTPSGGSDALWIVGGSTSEGSYTGLQRYTFADSAWETIAPSTLVTQNRLGHASIYLSATDELLVYAGTQEGSVFPTVQSFTIAASPPYGISSYESFGPPAVFPILLPWDDTSALYIGGSGTNTQAWIFNPALATPADSSKAWVQSAASLSAPLANFAAMEASMVVGDDGSKSVYTFDFTVSPNAVSRTVLVDASGNPVPNSAPITSRSLLERDQGGNLTLANWPPYNASMVPTTVRLTSSLAQDDSGLVIVSGGDAKDVLCMFQARDNSWANATQMLVAQNPTPQGVLTESSSSIPSTTSTSSTSSTTLASSTVILTTPTPVAPSVVSESASPTSTPNSSPAPFPTTILAAVLGSIAGAAVLLLCIVLFIRWRQDKKQFDEVGHARRASGLSGEKDEDYFTPSTMVRKRSTNYQRGHVQDASQSSFSSMAILMGRVGRGDPKENTADGNTYPPSNMKPPINKPAISRPIPVEQSAHTFAIPPQAKPDQFRSVPEEPAPSQLRGSRAVKRGSGRRSSGWNRYWSGGSALNILGLGSRKSTMEGSDTSSLYSEMPRPIETKAPAGPALNTVAQGSPTVSYTPQGYPLHRAMSGQIERSTSNASVSSYAESQHGRDNFSSGVPSSVHDSMTWNHQPQWGSLHWGQDQSRVPSNVYSESNYAGSINQNAREASSHARDGVPMAGAPETSRRAATPQTSDMSWLNLGGDSRI